MIDALCSQRHYADHIAPVWLALPEDVRGRFFVPPKPRTLAGYVEALGIEPTVLRRPPRDTTPILIAGWMDDYMATVPRPVALIEHGVGQPYLGVSHPAHPGGQRRARVRLFLCPNASVAERNLAVYPEAVAAVVGASHLDRWHFTSGHGHTSNTDGPIALSFHFDSQVAPEARSAWPHYGPAALQALADAFPGRIRGHAHPRVLERFRGVYEAAGIEVIDRFADVLDQASLYIVDNSSTAPEFASTGRPVIFLNSPEYRRDVHHGWRFWEWTERQPTVDHLGQLVATVQWVLAEPDACREGREAMVRQAYAYTDGNAAERAADAVLGWLATQG